MLDTGARLGRYEILEPLGAGGMGIVYRARDHRLERDVAIKVLPEDMATDPHRLARFEREAKAVARLDHPNILAIHDFGAEGTVAYAVMDLLQGASLREHLSSGVLGWTRAAGIGMAVARGLAAAHDRGVIHRDLKPENIFSLGCVIYEMLTGRRPFEGDTAAGSVRRAGQRVRITAQLVSTADGSHLWSERFDRELTDVLALEDEIAASIAERLRVELKQDEREKPPPLVDVEAHCLFLEGRYFFARGTPEALAQAKTCFEHAVERDARFAQAFDSLAELWWWLGIMMYLQHAPLRMIEEAHELSGGIPFTLGFLAYAYGRAGRRGDARGLLDHAQTAAADAYVPPSTLALGYVGLDEWDDAFDWWDRAIECRDPLIIPIKTFPFFDPVRGEHRYLEMLRRMNLPVN